MREKAVGLNGVKELAGTREEKSRRGLMVEETGGRFRGGR